MSGTPFAPVFAKGKSAQQTITNFSLSGTGAQQVVCSATTGISVGHHVFVSDSTNTRIEYLGKAVAVTSTIVTTQFIRQYAGQYGTGFLWRPTVVWQSTLPGIGSKRLVRDPGIELVETSGSVPMRTQVADEETILRLAFNKVPLIDWAGYVFFARTSVGRMAAFTIAWWNVDAQWLEVSKVIDRSVDRPMEAEHTAHVLRSWACDYTIVAAGTYVS